MVQMSENAAAVIAKMLEKNGMPGGGLRIAIRAGGCSGYSYVFAWEAEPKPTDEVFDGPGGARLFIDPRSHRLLDGTVLDYDTALISRGFTFSNPHAKSTCGCGTSFST